MAEHWCWRLESINWTSQPFSILCTTHVQGQRHQKVNRINHEIKILRALTFREQTTTMHYDCIINLILPVCFVFRSPEILDMTRFDQTNNSITIGIGGINCTGSEQYLAECSISRWENSTCSSNFVAISCSKFILRLIWFPSTLIVFHL